MATPNNFLHRYPPLPLAFSFPGWPLAAQQMLALPPLGKYPHLPQPFAFPYMHPNPYFALNSLPAQIGQGSFSTAPPQAQQQQLQGGVRGQNFQNKNQKNLKGNSCAAVIEISDDEAPGQTQKGRQEKSASNSTKNPSEQCPINKTLIEPRKKDPPCVGKKQQRKKSALPEAKQAKTKQIYKPSHHKKKSRPEERTESGQQRRMAVHSQRIIEKNGIKREPYRLSKKERELLEIGFLRDLVNEVMTGPQFQARLPAFRPQKPSSQGCLQQWKKELKEKLLERIEKDDE